jgi:hypothetical protein
MIYIRLQNHSNNMVVAEHGIQTYELVVVMLLLLFIFSVRFFVPTNAHP